jgi:proline iminopeptidase
MLITRRGLLRSVASAPAVGLASRAGLALADADETAGHAAVNGQQLYYVTLGRGTPVIFLHGGLGFDHEYFRPFADALSDSAQVVYYDHLGHGKSDRPANFDDLTFARLSADCAGLADALGLGKFVLVGHSYGGFIALDFAFRYPDRLAGLVLTCTAPDLKSGLRDPLGGAKEQVEAFKRLFAGPAANATDEMFRDNWMTALPLYYNNASPPPNILADIDRRTIYSAAGFNRGGKILAAYDFAAKLPGLAVHTIVQYGAGDIFRFGDNERMAKSIPGAKVTYFPNSGHWPFQEETAAYLTALRGFVARV